MKWFIVKQLFLESSKSEFVAFRIQIALKAENSTEAIMKANSFGRDYPHPHGNKPNVTWEYLGPLDILACYMPVGPNGILYCYMDKGSDWSDGLSYLKPAWEFEIIHMTPGWNPPENLYLAECVYYTDFRKDIGGKITTLGIVIECDDPDEIINHTHSVVSSKIIRSQVHKVRKECIGRKILSEYIGISEIMPIYEPVRDGMELDRTVQTYKSKRSVQKLLTNLKS